MKKIIMTGLLLSSFIIPITSLAHPKHSGGDLGIFQEHKNQNLLNGFYQPDAMPPGLKKNGKIPPGLAKKNKIPPGWNKEKDTWEDSATGLIKRILR